MAIHTDGIANDFVKDLETVRDVFGGPNIYNFSPVLHRTLKQHDGIRITGKFKTDDGTTSGQMSHITVLRDKTNIVPYDGFGIAWRRGDGTKYNVYIVDSTALDEEVFILNEIIIADMGINDFLAAGKQEILKDTWYQFQVEIQTNKALDAWIWKDGDLFTPDNSNRTVFLGATNPLYKPRANGTDFGVSVTLTQNFQWWYDDINIVSIADTFPIAVFKMKALPSDFASGEKLNVNYYGAASKEDPAVYDTSAYVWNETNQAWELMGTHTNTLSANIEQKKLTKQVTDVADYRDADNLLTFIAFPTTSDKDAVVTSYYANIEGAQPSGIHQGNMLDIYVNAPTRIASTTTNATNVTSEIALTAANSFSLPIQEIQSVVLEFTGEELEENIDYALVINNEATSFSTRADMKLVFTPELSNLSVDVTYNYYQDGTSLQTLVEGDTYRNIGADNLAKISPPFRIIIDQFDYNGGLAEADMDTVFVNYINGLSNTIEISDLIALASDNGATFIDLDTLDVKVKAYDTTGALLDHNVITSSYTISGIGNFFSSLSDVVGITRT